MLSRVEITNYRGFQSYKMEGLAQVNLLVGKNNSGKTALLEGIQFLTSGGDPSVLDDAARRRGEMLPGSDSDEVDVSHFFYGHRISNESRFTISGENGFDPVTVSINNAYETTQSRQRGLQSVLVIEVGENTLKQELDRPQRNGYVIKAGGRISRILNDVVMSRGQFVGPDPISSIAFAEIWNEVLTAGHVDEVLKAMCVLEPRVTSISPLAGQFNIAKSGFVVGIKDNKQPVPLGSLGDGMFRLLALASSLACTSDGALFADEIDTGLHYSVMPDMWNLVIQSAMARNAQVFATTHSWDCIEGLSLLCQHHPQLLSKVSVHTVDRLLNHSVVFTGESILGMSKYHIDPR